MEFYKHNLRLILTPGLRTTYSSFSGDSVRNSSVNSLQFENSLKLRNVLTEKGLKSMSMRGPGSGDKGHLTDFNETWPD